jgi:hypothetical protein
MKASYSSKPCFLLEDENNTLCQFTISDLINLIYINPLYPASYGANGDATIFLLNQTYYTKSNNTIWVQLAMCQENGSIVLRLYYSMNGGYWSSFTLGQMTKPSNVDLG